MDVSPPPLPMADCAVKTDMLGEDGTSAVWVGPREGLWALGWDEMAVASEMGMRQRPFPCRYCMAEPMSSSIILATWCSVTARLSLNDAVCAPFMLRPIPPLAWNNGTHEWDVQSPPLRPFDEKRITKVTLSPSFITEKCEGRFCKYEKPAHACAIVCRSVELVGRKKRDTFAFNLFAESKREEALG